MLKPFLFGIAMAAMMLAMGHSRIMSGEIDLTVGAVLFVLAHVAVGAIALSLALFVPQIRGVLQAHRPRVGHLALMMAGMLVSTSLIHGVMHGVVL